MTKDIYQKIAEKYKQKTGKELDEEAFTDKLVDVFIKLEEGTLDNVLESKLSQMSDDELIEELTSDLDFVHHLFGYASGAFNLCGVRGNTTKYPYLKIGEVDVSFEDDKERKYIEKKYRFMSVERQKGVIMEPPVLTREDVWPDERQREPEHNFKARIFGIDLLAGDYIFQMWYTDNTQAPPGAKKRKGCYTTYTLVVPKDKKKEVVPRIKESPNLILDLFRNIFGQFDNSEGEMKLDPNFKHIIEKPEVKK